MIKDLEFLDKIEVFALFGKMYRNEALEVNVGEPATETDACIRSGMEYPPFLLAAIEDEC